MTSWITVSTYYRGREDLVTSRRTSPPLQKRVSDPVSVDLQNVPCSWSLQSLLLNLGLGENGPFCKCSLEWWWCDDDDADTTFTGLRSCWTIITNIKFLGDSILCLDLLVLLFITFSIIFQSWMTTAKVRLQFFNLSHKDYSTKKTNKQINQEFNDRWNIWINIYCIFFKYTYLFVIIVFTTNSVYYGTALILHAEVGLTSVRCSGVFSPPGGAIEAYFITRLI